MMSEGSLDQNNQETIWDVLILGAGICGLSAATALIQKQADRQEQLTICIVDKGRGVGGRMATRRANSDTDEFVWDHGAQFIRFRSDEGQQLGQKWCEQSILLNWLNTLPQWTENQILQHPEQSPRYAGSQGMTTLPKFLAKQLEENGNTQIKSGLKIISIEQKQHGAQPVWQLKAESGETLCGRSLLLTAPVPQSLALLETIPELSAQALQPLQPLQPLRQIHYEPCLTLLIGLSQTIPSSNLNTLGLQDALQFIDHPVLGWIANNQQKGISSQPSFTIQANGQWSLEHFEDEESVIINRLLEESAPYLDFNPDSIAYKSLMKWRYSIPLSTYSQPFYKVPVELPLFLAGDAFETHVGAKRVEGSMLSGLAVASCLKEEFLSREISTL